MSDCTMKRCTKCGQEKPATHDFFPLDKRMRLGVRSWCHECLKLRAQERRRTKGIPPQRYQLVIDGEKQCTKCKEWKKLEFFPVSNQTTTGYSSHCKSCVNAQIRDIYANVPGYRERKYAWRTKNADKAKLTSKITHAKRHAQKKKAQHNKFTKQDWQLALNYFGGCCAACGKPPDLWHKLVPDHWVALSRGGDNTPLNIIPLCHSVKGGVDGCNTTKHAREAIEWLQDRFGKRKAKQILKRINDYFEWVKTQQE